MAWATTASRSTTPGDYNFAVRLVGNEAAGGTVRAARPGVVTHDRVLGPAA